MYYYSVFETFGHQDNHTNGKSVGESLSCKSQCYPLFSAVSIVHLFPFPVVLAGGLFCPIFWSLKVLISCVHQFTSPSPLSLDVVILLMTSLFVLPCRSSKNSCEQNITRLWTVAKTPAASSFIFVIHIYEYSSYTYSTWKLFWPQGVCLISLLSIWLSSSLSIPPPLFCFYLVVIHSILISLPNMILLIRILKG